MKEKSQSKDNLKLIPSEKIFINPLPGSLLPVNIIDPQKREKIESIHILLRDLLQLPLEYSILILDNSRFEDVNIFSLLNFSKDMKGGFLDTGSISTAVIIMARKIFDVEVIGSSRESAYSYVPQCDWIPDSISFLHITSTNELEGNRVSKFPKISLPVICDRSADLFTDQVPFHGLDLVYAHGDDQIIPYNLSIALFNGSILKTISPSTLGNPMLKENIENGNEMQFNDLFLLHQTLQKLKQNGGIDEQISSMANVRCPYTGK